MVERQPSKLNVAGSNPVSRSINVAFDFILAIRAHVAQQAEHIHGKDGVAGSNPAVGSIWNFG